MSGMNTSHDDISPKVAATLQIDFSCRLKHQMQSGTIITTTTRAAGIRVRIHIQRMIVAHKRCLDAASIK